MKKIIALAVVTSTLLFTGCTQETQNEIGRSIQNWTGTNGVLDIYMGEKLVQRYIKIDKLSTAVASNGSGVSRNYRYGYGYLDLNENYKVDAGEKKLYFEVSNFSTSYIFYDNPKN
jgi:outer membrane murein-binding lipoprotein Lpp